MALENFITWLVSAQWFQGFLLVNTASWFGIAFADWLREGGRDQSLRQQLENMTTERDEARTGYNDAIRERDNADRERADADRQRDELIWQRDQMRQERDESIRQGNQVRQERDEVLRNCAEIIQHANDAEKQLGEVHRLICAMVAKWQRENSGVDVSTHTAPVIGENLVDALRALRSLVEKREQTTTAHTAALEERIRSLTRANAALTANNTGPDAGSPSPIGGNSSSNNKQPDASKQQITNLQQANKTLTEANTRLTNQVNDQTRDIQKLKKEGGDAQKAASDDRARTAGLNDEVQRLQQRIDDLEKELGNCKSGKHDCNDGLRTAREELEKATAEIARLQSERSKFRQALTQLQSDLESCREHDRRRATENTNLKEEASKNKLILFKKIHELQDTIERQQWIIEGVKSMLDAEREKNAANAQQNVDVQREYTNCQRLLKAAKHRIDTLERNIAEREPLPSSDDDNDDDDGDGGKPVSSADNSPLYNKVTAKRPRKGKDVKMDCENKTSTKASLSSVWLARGLGFPTSPTKATAAKANAGRSSVTNETAEEKKNEDGGVEGTEQHQNVGRADPFLNS